MKYLFLILALSTSAFAQWFEVNLPQYYPVFNKIKFFNKEIGIIVGKEGTILRTTNGGEYWELIPSVNSKNLNSLFINRDLIYACGDSGTLIRSSNMGQSWSTITFPYNIKLNSIYFIDSLNGYTVGENSIFKTTNGGNTWMQSSFFNSFFNSIHCINKDTCFAAALRILSPGNFESSIYKTTDEGKTWFVQRSESGEELYEIFFVDSVGYIVGEHEKVFRTSNYGYTWYEPRPTTPPLSESYLSVYFTDTQNGWVTAVDNKIYKTTNGGISWNVQLSRWDINKLIYLHSIDFKDSLSGFAVGSQRINSIEYAGIIFKTTNGGITFVDDNYNSNSLSKYELYQNYPNPFNPTTKIKFTIGSNVRSNKEPLVTLKVFDLLGREVAVLVNEQKQPGEYEVEFDAGKYGLSSGVYFYQLKAGEFTAMKKLVYMK